VIPPFPLSMFHLTLGEALTIDEVRRLFGPPRRDRPMFRARGSGFAVTLRPPPALAGARVAFDGDHDIDERVESAAGAAARAAEEHRKYALSLLPRDAPMVNNDRVNRETARRIAALHLAREELGFVEPPPDEVVYDDRSGAAFRRNPAIDEWFEARDRAVNQFVKTNPKRFQFWIDFTTRKVRPVEPQLAQRYEAAGMAGEAAVIQDLVVPDHWYDAEVEVRPEMAIVPLEVMNVVEPVVVPVGEADVEAPKKVNRIGSRQRRRLLRRRSPIPVAPGPYRDFIENFNIDRGDGPDLGAWDDLIAPVGGAVKKKRNRPGARQRKRRLSAPREARLQPPRGGLPPLPMLIMAALPIVEALSVHRGRYNRMKYLNKVAADDYNHGVCDVPIVAPVVETPAFVLQLPSIDNQVISAAVCVIGCSVVSMIVIGDVVRRVRRALLTGCPMYDYMWLPRFAYSVGGAIIWPVFGVCTRLWRCRGEVLREAPAAEEVVPGPPVLGLLNEQVSASRMVTRVRAPAQATLREVQADFQGIRRDYLNRNRDLATRDATLLLQAAYMREIYEREMNDKFLEQFYEPVGGSHAVLYLVFAFSLVGVVVAFFSLENPLQVFGVLGDRLSSSPLGYNGIFSVLLCQIPAFVFGVIFVSCFRSRRPRYVGLPGDRIRNI